MSGSTGFRWCLACLACLTVVGAVAVPAMADVPRIISYQGRLTDAGGVRVDATVALDFYFYDADTGGNLLWSENHPSVVVTKGLFTVYLGTPSGGIPNSALNPGGDTWVGIAVDAGTELVPRIKIGSVPYVIKSANAEQLVAPNTLNPYVQVDGNGGLNIGTSWFNSGPGDGQAVVGSNLGIGTNSFGDTLNVAGGGVFGSGWMGNNAGDGRIAVQNSLSLGTFSAPSMLNVYENVSIGNNYSQSYGAPGSGLIVEGPVGIGTPYPYGAWGQLGVNSGVAIGSSYAQSYYAPNGIGLIVEGPVGIGTPNPYGANGQLGVYYGAAIGPNYSQSYNAPNGYGMIVEGPMGVGTPSPYGQDGQLGVYNGIAVGTSYSPSYPAPSSGMIVEGPVGIGVPYPYGAWGQLGVSYGVAVGGSYSQSYDAGGGNMIAEGNLGLGTPTPYWNRLEVSGSAVIGSSWAGNGNPAPSNGMIVEGAVGIGTNSPQGMLDVNGAVAVAGDPGATGQVLTSQGPGVAPVWASASGGELSDFRYPDGLNGGATVIQTGLQTTPYTVPSGKTLYMNHTGGSGQPMIIAGINLNDYDQPARNPVLVGAGQTVAATNDAGYFIGVLVDEGVAAISQNNLLSTPYTVPTGKALHIHSTRGNVIVQGITFTASTVNTPVVLTEGIAVTSDSNANSFNGYLRDN